MKQHVVEAAGGRDYDWASDHIYVKTAADLTGGRVTVVEDPLRPGFHLAPHYHKEMTEVFYVLEGEITFVFEFVFEDETVVATRGMTVNIPPNVVHEVRSEPGGKLITIFSPGGFDRYLEQLASLSVAQSEDAALMRSLAEEFDTWGRALRPHDAPRRAGTPVSILSALRFVDVGPMYALAIADDLVARPLLGSCLREPP